jgi:hypothetical protein
MLRDCIVRFAMATFLLASAPAQNTVAESSPSQPEQSLADIAKAIRAKKRPEIVITEDDGKALFKEVNTIFEFANSSSELPIRTPVKHKLIGREETDKRFTEGIASSDASKKIQRSELVLKKFGMLPSDFHMQNYLTDRGGSEVAGFYDPRDKTMYLLNWIPLEQQRLVMAHELTHALQDQNFNLMKWRYPDSSAKDNDDPTANEKGLETEARVAVSEGQAMLVYLDYEIKPLGFKLSESTDHFDVLRTRILSVYDSPVTFHSAPLVFTETAKFPYYDGVTFELEVLKRAGTHAAFAGVFARPPLDTHEIMQPEAYLAGTHTAAFSLPNLLPALGSDYKPYDSGSIGELDVRIMAKQFGRDNDAYSVAPNWNGGAYLTVRKPTAAGKADSELTLSDIALMYVSRWKTAAAAERFADIYKSAVIRRSKLVDDAAAKVTKCNDRTVDCTARWYSRFDTEDGPVVMEISQDNTLMITQSLDDSAVEQVKLALGRSNGESQASSEPELSLRFMDVPVVRAMREEILQQLTGKLAGN